MSRLSYARAATSYARFEHWVSTSLELYKPALAPLLFPVFAHCVLGLCRERAQEAAAAGEGEEEEGGGGSRGEDQTSGGDDGSALRQECLASARALLARHGALHRENGFADEVEQLGLVCAGGGSRAACARCPLVARMDAHCFKVGGLGRTAEMLLLTFLEEAGLHEILHIVQARIETQPAYVHPATLARAGGEAAAAAAAEAAEVAGGTGNKRKGPLPAAAPPKRRKPVAHALSGVPLTGGTGSGQGSHLPAIMWGVLPKRARKDEMDRARSIADEAAKTAAEVNYTEKTKKERAHALKIDQQHAEKRARRPPWIGRAGPTPSLAAQRGGEWYREMVEKLMVRIKARQGHAEAEDARKCVKLGYPSDHRKSKVAWFADNGLEINAPSELSGIRTKGMGKGRSELKTRERNLGKIEEEERRARIEADRARAFQEDAHGPVLPSMVSVSLKNNYGAVACSAVSRDGVQVAAGYTDSNVVRVWRLDGGKHLGYPYGFSSSSSSGGGGGGGGHAAGSGAGGGGGHEGGSSSSSSGSSSGSSSSSGSGSGNGGHNNNRQEDSPLAASPHAVVESDAVLVGHSMGVTGCAFLPDNEWLLSSSEDSSIRLWNLSARTSVCAYRSSADSRHPIWDVACNPLGYYFASASHDRTATLWCTEYASPLRRFVGHLSDVDTVRFHPNGSMIATGSLDRTVRLWDARSGGCVRVFGLAHQQGGGGSQSGGGGGHLGGVTALAFSPNGQFLVSGGQDTQLCVWDLQAGKMLTSVPWAGRGELGKGNGFARTHITPEVRSLEFSMDGTVLASATTDHVVRCWDAALFHRWQAEVENEEEEEAEGDEEEAAARASAVAAGVGGSLNLGGRGGGGAVDGKSGAGGEDEDDAEGSAGGDGGSGGSMGADGHDVNNSNVAVPSGDGFYRKDLFCAIPAGSTDVFKLRFTERNLLVGAGAQVSNRVGPNGERKDPTVLCAV